jgi:hypothetical protein
VGVLVWVVLAVVIVGVVVALLGWDRYRGSRRHAGEGVSQRTNEVFLDPATGQQLRVWYNPSTGEREYRAESP